MWNQGAEAEKYYYNSYCYYCLCFLQQQKIKHFPSFNKKINLLYPTTYYI